MQARASQGLPPSAALPASDSPPSLQRDVRRGIKQPFDTRPVAAAPEAATGRRCILFSLALGVSRVAPSREEGFLPTPYDERDLAWIANNDNSIEGADRTVGLDHGAREGVVSTHSRLVRRDLFRRRLVRVRPLVSLRC